MTLKTRLSGLKEKDANTYLSALWRTFAKTEAFEAIELTLDELIQDAEARLFRPEASPELRSFAAGEVSGLRRFLVSIGASIRFDPNIAYGPSDSASEDYPDYVPADTDTLV
jgi:hypothetical protein